MKFFGHEFRSAKLLETALTTPSYRMNVPTAEDNQRLEFLGDAVLGFMAAEEVFASRPDVREGPLTVRRTHMVSSAALCAAAERLGLGPRLKRNRGAEALPRNSKTLADAVEAIVGAAYLDGGMAAAREVFAALELSAHADDGELVRNPRSELQERTQALAPPRTPAYELLRRTGAAHCPEFTVRVTVEGVGEAEATASSRKEAETRAAAELLKRFS